MIDCNTNGTVILNRTGDNLTCVQPKQPAVKMNVSLMSEEAKMFLLCIFIITFVLGVTGNAVVCWVIGKKKQLSGCDAFVISLACADLLASAFALLQPMNYFIWQQRWHLGFALCKILPTIAPTSLAASSWSLALIAADRYRAIVTPMKHRLSTNSNACVIILMWAIAIIVTAPHVYIKRYEHHRSEYFCVDDRSILGHRAMVTYAIAYPVAVWIIPVLVTAVLYGICIRKLRESSLKNEHSDSMKRRILENRKVIRMFILIGALFCICTLPYAILYALFSLHNGYNIGSFDSEAVLTLTYSIFALSIMNSCMNPFIYAKRQPEMKEFVKRICCKAVCLDTKAASMKRYSLHVQSSSKKQKPDSIEMPHSSFLTMVSFQQRAFDE